MRPKESPARARQYYPFPTDVSSNQNNLLVNFVHYEINHIIKSPAYANQCKIGYTPNP